MSSFPYHAYTVGWVCALPIELAAAEKLLDEKHPSPPRDDNDSNLYTLGQINQHNVVIAALPAGKMGLNPAAVVTSRMQARFPSIRFSLLVGVGGAVPSDSHDIRLGDVVISQPHGGHGGVVQYDFGKSLPGGFQRTGFLSSPPDVLLHALTKLQARQMVGGVDLSVHLDRFAHLPAFSRSRAGRDLLFQPHYQHVDGPTCEGCDEGYLANRAARASRAAETVIHSGTIASGNQVMRDAATRDAISQELGGALCFEMEAAGMISSCPCLVIRGICDYADSHKSKAWQPYAAAAAAACAKEILSDIPRDDLGARYHDGWGVSRVSDEQHVQSPAEPAPLLYNTVSATRRTASESWYTECVDGIEKALQGDTWSEVMISGDRGSGKTQVLADIAEKFKDTHSVFWFSAKTPQAFQDGFASAAEAVFMVDPTINDRHHWDCVVKLRAWLSDPTHGKWLLFVDDLPRDLDPPTIRTFFPTSPLGGIVISTMADDFADLVDRSYRLDPRLPLDKGLDLFSMYNPASGRTAAVGSVLLQAVNFHPLGVIIISSFCCAHNDRFLEGYDQKLEKLLSEVKKYRSIPPEIALPLSLHLDALTNTPASYILTVLAILDSNHIGERILNASKTLESTTGPNREWLSAFTSPTFQQAIKALQSLFLLEAKRDINGTFYEVPSCVVECVLQNFRDDPPTFQLALETAFTLLDSIIAPHRFGKRESLDEAVSTIEQHYITLSRHACTAGIRPYAEKFQNLGILVALYHFRKAARLGLDVWAMRSFRGWLSRNRTLSGEDTIDTSLWDEVSPYLASHSKDLTPTSQQCEQLITGSVSAVLWKNVEGLLAVSAISRAWFTVKDDVLAAARAVGKSKYMNAEEVEDRIDKSAHEAIQNVVVMETKEYARAATESTYGSGSQSTRALKSIVVMLARSLDGCLEILQIPPDSLTNIISEAIGSDIFGLTRLAGSAWASVLETEKHRIATVVQSLVQQSTNVTSLGETVLFTIEQLSRRKIQGYVGEIGDVIWEALRCTGNWIAIMILHGLCHAMLSRINEVPGLDSQGNLASIKAIIARANELLMEEISALSPEYLHNWEWNALKRNVVLRHRAVHQVIQLLDGTGNRSNPTDTICDGYSDWSELSATMKMGITE